MGRGYNHRPDCTCGWCTSKWGSRSRATVSPVRRSQPEVQTKSCYQLFGISPIRPIYESYTIPNARCPVCGAAVFFYQSPNGGRVFFDELGPPWPKHPCTSMGDTFGKHYVPTPVGDRTNKEVVRPIQWQQEGWQPFFLSDVYKDGGLYKLHGKLGNVNLSFYVCKKKKIPMFVCGNVRDYICFAKGVRKGVWEVSIYYQTRTTFLCAQDFCEAKQIWKKEKRERVALQQPPRKKQKKAAHPPKKNVKKDVITSKVKVLDDRSNKFGRLYASFFSEILVTCCKCQKTYRIRIDTFENRTVLNVVRACLKGGCVACNHRKFKVHGISHANTSFDLIVKVPFLKKAS